MNDNETFLIWIARPGRQAMKKNAPSAQDLPVSVRSAYFNSICLEILSANVISAIKNRIDVPP